jgi:hypothetical protein
MSPSEIAAYCQCSYNTLETQIPFSRFRDFEDYLRANVGKGINTVDDLTKPGSKYGDIVGLMKSCRSQGPSTQSADAATMAATAATGATTTSR